MTSSFAKLVTLRWIEHATADYGAVMTLRRSVLRIPLGLDYTPEDLMRESADAFLTAWLRGQCVGCLVMTRLSEANVKMRQVAVEPELQGNGIGQRMVLESELWSRENGFTRIVLNARDSAVPFYVRLGYQAVAEPFIEVGIPHQQMIKDLTLIP